MSPKDKLVQKKQSSKPIIMSSNKLTCLKIRIPIYNFLNNAKHKNNNNHSYKILQQYKLH